MTENKGNHYASHDLRGNVCEELPQRRNLLSGLAHARLVSQNFPAFNAAFPS